MGILGRWDMLMSDIWSSICCSESKSVFLRWPGKTGKGLANPTSLPIMGGRFAMTLSASREVHWTESSAHTLGPNRPTARIADGLLSLAAVLSPDLVVRRRL